MSSTTNSNSDNDTPKDTSKRPPNKAKRLTLDDLRAGHHIPGAVQIGAITTYGDVMSGKGTWKVQHTIESPTIEEIYNRVQKEMEKTGPSEPGQTHNGTPALAIRLPNNGYPEGACAGCGAEDVEDGGTLRQCARCKGRKYCGRACQKLDWRGHRLDCVAGEVAGEELIRCGGNDGLVFYVHTKRV